ncbi:MAG: hypothetical protein UX10_C0007G0023 [Candidatus Magasanikbacteria bacterium GW2011_GWA2_45_39]|uniref:Uncharacterized protein n=2 Tax=Candidatus Magasanikiibacteriota TaxID=1752731 RepID=A0A0G1Q7I6_9BACT|nr:MAG: hypothetical protein UX10_C0007G0023 [Candidatus Magasanikbacteria bacterium GW2011_GWA2_45_39]KKU13673.1 MAG: hypothetical protein UX20_C0016G0021 [Candidatus Magasanikbacteria bacterium GW2011_GWC2_45_8]HBW74255.1 hypothetical protein [Candidatus Magasanikbacteria bacterium]
MKYLWRAKKYILSAIISVLFFGLSVGVNAAAPATVDLPNPLGTTDIFVIVGDRVVKPVLGIIGSIALIMFVYGGFLWLTSGGSPDKIKKGRDVFMWSGIGIIVILTSYILLKFVFDALAGKL